MLKLDKEKRLLISREILEISEFSIPCKVYCIYDNGALVLKQNPKFGTDKVVSSLMIDPKGRIFLGKLFGLIGFEETVKFLVWAEPGAVHIEKIEAK